MEMVDINTIKTVVEELSSEASALFKNEDAIENAMITLDEAEEKLNEFQDAEDDLIDDAEYQDLMEKIDEVRHIFAETRDGLYGDEDEDEYGFDDDDDEDYDY